MDGEWSTSGRRSIPEERTAVRTEQEAGRDPAAVFIIYSKEKPLDPVGNQISNPTAAILTKQLLRYIIYFITIIFMLYIIYNIHNYNIIKNRLKSGNACYHSVQNLLSSNLLPKNRNIILTVFCMGVKLGRSHCGRNLGWGCLKIGC